MQTYTETIEAVERTSTRILIFIVGLLIVIASIHAHNVHVREIERPPAMPTTTEMPANG